VRHCLHDTVSHSDTVPACDRWTDELMPHDQSSRGKNQDGLLGWIWPGNNFSGLAWVGFQTIEQMHMGIAHCLTVN